MHLTPTEFALLRFFLAHHDEIVERMEAAEAPAVKDSSLASSTRAASRNILGNSPALVVLNEALIVLLSCAAYADDQGGTLAGLTAASALLGAAAGGSDLKNPKCAWIL